MRWLLLLLIFVNISSCQVDKQGQATTTFVQKNATETRVLFNNRIEETAEFNYYKYPYLYLGGGVATGDFNNDGLTDIFFTGNMVENTLYLNQGEWQFLEIGKEAGVSGDSRWYTGIALVDINHDGWLDIYVSVSGSGFNTKNQLFVNRGISNEEAEVAIPTFTEEAEKWGIADRGPSIQSTFFDYDKDGDLDLYVGNYPTAPFGSSNRYYKEKMENLALQDSDHLYENKGDGHFMEVSTAAGVANYGLTLGVSVADLNADGWEDIYLSNDFSTPDRMFINQGDGTFTESLQQSTRQTSLFGMGSDAADYNNDGLVDIVQVDMTPKDNRRNKENMASMNPSLFWNMVQSGFHYQYMYNSLQLNRGRDGNGIQQFSNVSSLAGISATDWSWGPLFADLDNDGWKDLVITNGIKRDVNNRDFVNSMKVKINFSRSLENINYEDIPSEKIENYAFQNNGDLTFTDVSEEWGLNLKGFSHGIAYADLDNDGDLDLVTNNMDMEASLFQNQTMGKHFLRIKLDGPTENPLGIGTQVELKDGKGSQFQSLSLTRGFQSSVEPILHFGLGQKNRVEKVNIRWPDGKEQLLSNVAADQVLTISYADALSPQKAEELASKKTPFQETPTDVSLEYRHRESSYNDYNLEPLLPYQYSRLGPALSTGDVNGDGLEDFFVGNAYNEPASLFIQNATGAFDKLPGPWEEDKKYEDIGSLLFDADGDNDLDLYVISGGGEFVGSQEYLLDRLYINLGEGVFEKATASIPELYTAGSCVKAGDFDGDGDQDLFVGGRLIPGRYPSPASSHILRNEGGVGQDVCFTEVSNEVLPALTDLGMVTDALWSDFNEDGKLDLIIAAEWMPVQFFRNEGEAFSDQTSAFGLDSQVGWWQSLAEGDFDGDGDTDYVAGNIGNNLKYKASPEAPFSVYSGDFDGNGKTDIVLGYEQAGQQFPLRGRQCSSEQIPAIELKFRDYESFASATLIEVYGESNLGNALQYHATQFATSLIVNRGDSVWSHSPLPNLAQVSSVNAIEVQDWNQDGNLDLVIAGNLYWTEIETPRNDASLGLLLIGNGAGAFQAIPNEESGLFIHGDVKDLKSLRLGKDETSQVLISARNNNSLQLFDYHGYAKE
ncbi:MAG: VCBS repeat-containing protein [Bacteroidota bacterium]